MNYTLYFRLSLLCLAFGALDYLFSQAQTELQTRTVAQNLNVPWEIIWGEDGNIWYTERDGSISYINPSTGQIREIARFEDTHQQSESGMLGMAIDQEEGVTHIYVVYNYRVSGQTMEKVVSFDYNGSSVTNQKTLLQGIKGAAIHDGARIWLAPDKTLNVTTGEAGDKPLAQNMNSLNGKVLRMKTDGSIPPDNPNPSSYIWSSGHRNAQGMVFANGKLYISEHGATTDDEINIIEKGRNYGWPNVEGYCDNSSEQAFCNANNVVEPIYIWTPTIAPAGLDYYSHDAIPEWKNCLLLTTLKGSRLVVLKLNEAGDRIENATEYFNGEFGRLRDLCIAPDGRVFISTSNSDNGSNNNRIIEIKPKNMSAPSPPAARPTKEESDGGSFRVFPNPASDYLIIDRFVDSFKEKAEIKVYNSIGSRMDFIYSDGNPIDIKEFPTGLYFIAIDGEARPFAVIR